MLEVATETSETGGTAVLGSHMSADTRTDWGSDQLYGVKMSFSGVSCDNSDGSVLMTTMTFDSGFLLRPTVNEAGALPASKLV